MLPSLQCAACYDPCACLASFLAVHMRLAAEAKLRDASVQISRCDSCVSSCALQPSHTSSDIRLKETPDEQQPHDQHHCELPSSF